MMTREEAIKIISDMILDMEYSNGTYKQEYTEKESKRHLALYSAKEALRGPTREMVERMRGEWKHYLPPLGAGNVQCRCTNCGRTPDVETPFCAWCGAPMTDKAVDMMLEKLEEFENA